MSYSTASYARGSEARKLKRDYEPQQHSVINGKRKNAVMQISFAYVIMIVAAVILMSFVAAGYVALQSDVTNLRKEKGQLISVYEGLKNSNDLYKQNMMSAVDLKEVERIAVEELGMKMAGQGQVMTYTDELDDYVKQYGDIPVK